MTTIFEDDAAFDAFQSATRLSQDPAYSEYSLKVKLLDWSERSDQPLRYHVAVPDLADLPPSRLRVIFAPLDTIKSPVTNGIVWLFRHYSVPSAFLEERLQSVTHSFGALDNIHGYSCAWLHLLCKRVSTSKDAADKVIIANPQSHAPEMEHADWTWFKSGYFIRWRKGSPDASSEITLLCFGASSQIIHRFLSLPASIVLDHTARDPLGLFALIFDDHAQQMHTALWNLSDAFGHIETDALMLKGRATFTGMHNVAKHIIYLQESSDAGLLALKKLSGCHSATMADASTEDKKIMQNTARKLTHVETQLETSNLRSRSLEKRMQNVIALSFHIVTQEGNRIMLLDSNAMTTIAFVMLVFLPMTTIATIFGSQFFNQSADGASITMSQDFWIFWLISIPVTMVVVYAWYVINQRSWQNGPEGKWDWGTLFSGRK